MTPFENRAARGPARVDRSGIGPAMSTAVSMPGIAFVFQGGGSLSAPQVGMLWALTEAGVRPGLVVGSSAGAVNAVAFASDPSPEGLDELEAVWVLLRRRQVAPFSLRTLLAVLTGRGDAVVSESGLRLLLERAALARTLRETVVPAHVVATDLASGQAVVVSDGATVPALLASSAFPGLYRSVEVGRRLPGAYHALRQILESAARGDLAAAQRPVHVLPAPTTRIVNPLDFGDTARLIDDGYRLATDWLSSHLAQPGTPARADTSWPDGSIKRVVSAV